MDSDSAESRRINIETNLKVVGFIFRWMLIWGTVFGLFKVDLINGIITKWIS